MLFESTGGDLGQVMPTAEGLLRQDLFKKVMSADAVAARLPYAIVIDDCQRFEMNDTMKFTGITEGNFMLIMRRPSCLVCEEITFVHW